jgi:hypothetical protein
MAAVLLPRAVAYGIGHCALSGAMAANRMTNPVSATPRHDPRNVITLLRNKIGDVEESVSSDYVAAARSSFRSREMGTFRADCWQGSTWRKAGLFGELVGFLGLS